ncbi:MAG: DMT family transporter [Moritella sp.]|uniref:DMT family transporter n=1 Tax=unclassified Moritella TaxID=2637987 RepID=UPI0001569784|nr:MULTISPECIES: DMT family transporter [unclassified Moritella]EDM65786.1 Predicted permease of the drug/metabolite transporter (DMT)superfamily [Moritella sp. PE36]MBL1417811.1 DMT family transporter [Moritella sp.]NQZ94204.1 DMT family transporter [Moritella sp.]
MKNQKKAMLFGLITVLLWSTVASAFKITLSHFAPIQMVLIASLTSIVLLLGIAYQQKKLHLLKQYFIKQPLFYLTLGVINPFLYYLVLFKAYDLLPASQAQALNYTWAITLTLLSVPFLGQKIRKKDWVAILFSYTGALIIATKGDLLGLNFESPLGVALALLSTLIWASYWIINARNNNDPIVSLLLGFLLSLPFTFIATALLADFNFDSVEGILGAIYIGLFEMGISFILWLMAIKLATNTAQVSNLIFISPFISLFLLSRIVGEEIHPSTFIGLVTIIVGLVIQQINWRKKRRTVTAK